MKNSPFFSYFPQCQEKDCDYSYVDKLFSCLASTKDVTPLCGYYILDFCKQEIIFHASSIRIPNSSELADPTLLEITYPHDEHHSIQQVCQQYVAFLSQLPSEERGKPILSFNCALHINNPSSDRFATKRYSWEVFQKAKPLCLDARGNIFLLLVSYMPPNLTSGLNAHLQYKGTLYSLHSKIWKQEEDMLFDERDKLVLLYSLQGLTETEIADKLYLSRDSIKKIKQHLFSRIHAKTTKAAIYTISYFDII